MTSKMPAYKEVWFWVVFSPLLCVFGVCGALLYFAIVGADDRVSDDYYKEGRMINKRFEAESNAQRLGIKGVVDFDQQARELRLHLEGLHLPNAVQVSLSHPAQADLDQQFLLRKSAGDTYIATLKKPLSGRQYVIIHTQEGADNKWRVSTEINFDQTSSVPFEAKVGADSASGV